MVSLKGAIAEGEPMVFPHLREMFHSAGVEHDDIRPDQTAMVEDFEKLSVNSVDGEEVKGDDVRAMVHPKPSRSVLTNWTFTNVLFSLFHSNYEKLFKLLPLPKDIKYLLCMSLSFKKQKTFFNHAFVSFPFILSFHLFFYYIFFGALPYIIFFHYLGSCV